VVVLQPAVVWWSVITWWLPVP